MARMSIDDKLLRDPRVLRLARSCSWSRRETVGALLDVFAVVYDRERDVLPAADIDVAAERDGFADLMFEVDLAEQARGGVRIKGARERIKYLTAKVEAGRAGGLKSGESRRKSAKQKRSNREAPVNLPDPVPDLPPDPVPDPVPEDPDPPPARAIELPRPGQRGVAAQAPPPAEPRPGVLAVSPAAAVREDTTRTQQVSVSTPTPDPKLDRIVHSGPRHVHRATTSEVDQPTLDQLWRELELARARAAAARDLAIQPLVAHDVGRHELAESLAEASRVGQHSALVAQVRHAIAVAEAEARVAPEPGKADQLQWFTGAIFSPRNFRRLVAKPLKPRPKPRAATAPSELARPADPPLSDEERAELAELADRLAVNPHAAAAAELAGGRVPRHMETAKLVQMFGDSERAPPASAASEPPTDDNHDDQETA